MTDSLKIKRDFLKLLGNENPTKEDLQKLDCIPFHQLLKPIVMDSKKRGISFRMVAIRYNITLNAVNKIYSKQQANKQ